MAITDKSGAAGLLMWMQKHRPAQATNVEKRDPRILKLLDTVMSEYDSGRVTSLADIEVHALIDQVFAVRIGGFVA